MRALLWLVLAGLLVPPGAHADRTETRLYAAPTHDTSARFVDCKVFAPIDVDGSCFPLDGSERHLSLTIKDASGLPIPVHLLFRNATGIELAPNDFSCEPTLERDIPAGTVTLLVWLHPDDDFVTPTYCPAIHGRPTTGTLTLAFS